MSYIQTDNKLVTCPYDEAHRMKESRLQLHIAKCKLNHLDKLDKRICPFNATHLLDIGEYDHHLMNCPDRGCLDRQLARQVDKNNPFKGRTDVPQYSEPYEDDTEESWDTETATLELAPPPIGALVEPPAMSKPAERRKLYKDLHQLERFEKESDKTLSPSTLSPSVKPSGPPRQPKQQSETQKFQNAQPPNVLVIQNLGLGRGKPSTRIAANIFPKANEPSSLSYSSIVKDMGSLGLGRGQPVNKDPTPTCNYDDFPALGSGRGVARAPNKQSTRTPGSKPQ